MTERAPTHADDRVVAEIPKNKRETLRVSLSNYNGQDLISIRVWFEADDGHMRPSSKGLSCRVKMLPDIIEALAKAAQEVGVQPEIPGGAGGTP